MAGSSGLKMIAAILLATGLSGCGGMDESDPNYAEMQELSLWLKKLKAEDPDTGSLLAEECVEEVGVSLSKQGVLDMARCMRRKHDSGRRWVHDEQTASAEG